MSNLTWQEIEDILLTVRSRTWTDAYDLGREHGYAQAIASLHKPSADLDSLDFGKAILCELDDTVIKAKDALGHGSEKRGGSEHYGKTWTEHLERNFPDVKEPVFHATTGPRAIQIIRDGFKSGSHSDFGKGNVGSTSMTHNADWALEGHRGNYIFVMDEDTLRERGDVTDHKDPTAENEYERRFVGDKIPASEIKGLIINRKIGKMEREEAAEWGIPVTYRTADGWATLEPKRTETKAKDQGGHGSNKKDEQSPSQEDVSGPTPQQQAQQDLIDLGPELDRALPSGLFGKIGDKLLTAAAKTYMKLVGASTAVHTLIERGKDVFDNPEDLKQYGGLYNPQVGVAGPDAAHDHLKAATGISTHLAISVSSKILAHVLTKAKGKNKDAQETKAIGGFEDSDVREAVSIMRDLMLDTAKALDMDVDSVKLTDMLTEKLSSQESKAADDLIPSPATMAFVSAIKDKSVKWMLVAGISVAAEELQYKESDGSADGLSEERRNEQPDTFDPLVVLPIAVWTADDGQVYVVDGHKRVANARRLGVPNIRVQFIQASSFEEAKKIGERLNEKLGTKALDTLEVKAKDAKGHGSEKRGSKGSQKKLHSSLTTMFKEATGPSKQAFEIAFGGLTGYRKGEELPTDIDPMQLARRVASARHQMLDIGTKESDLAQFDEVLPLAHVEKIAIPGEGVRFDGAKHSAEEAVSDGQEMRVVHSGYMYDDEDGGTLLLRAKVVPK